MITEKTDRMSLNVASPEQVIDALRHACQCYYESSGSLQTDWQDPGITIWDQIADVLDGAATEITHILHREGYLD